MADEHYLKERIDAVTRNERPPQPQIDLFVQIGRAKAAQSFL